MHLLATLLHLALLTTNEYDASKKPDDTLLMEALKEYAIEAQPVDWNTDTVWTDFDAVLVYSTWDYYKNNEKFLDLLKQIEDQDVKVYNPLSVVRWNSSKRYLEDLENLGLKPIESLYISWDELDNLKQLLLEKGWDDCIIKPQISASGHNTCRFNLSNIEDMEARFKSYGEQYIVQPFAEEIITEGEWSFVFFENEYIHCVLKKPREGSFLVQNGSVTTIQPPEWMIKEAKHIIDTIHLPALKTRLDVIRRGDELRIMEVEMIEPNLHLKRFPGSENRLAKKIYERLQN
jgi:glutathione synthase/RimK-type ligase-like ATP-grasp enzyme